MVASRLGRRWAVDRAKGLLGPVFEDRLKIFGYVLASNREKGLICGCLNQGSQGC